MTVEDIKMPTKKPVLLGYTPRGTPVYDYAPDKPLLAPLLIHLAGFDELNEAAIEQPESEALEDDGNDTRKP
jgi:hypothetical protein